MWSFLKQADQGRKKDDKKDEKKCAGKARSFLQSWKINREWLKYEGGVMFCSICRGEEGDSSQTGAASKKVNSFVQGTTNFKLETIKDHEISKAHRSNSLKVRNRDKPVQETPADVALSSLNKVQMDRVKLLIRNTHAIMKNARPFTDQR